jgi:hypothetical protein
MVISGFFENVPRHLHEHRELSPGEEPENIVLQFNPRPAAQMLVACVCDRWTGSNVPDSYSFVTFTDEPPEEGAATGHQSVGSAPHLLTLPPSELKTVDTWRQYFAAKRVRFSVEPSKWRTSSTSSTAGEEVEAARTLLPSISGRHLSWLVTLSGGALPASSL